MAMLADEIREFCTQSTFMSVEIMFFLYDLINVPFGN